MWEYILGIIGDIFKDFIMMPLTFIIGLLTVKLKDVIFVGRYKRKLKIKDKSLNLNCFTANPNNHDTQEKTYLGYVFEYMSVGEIRSTFDKYYKDMNMTVQMSDLNFENIRSKHLNGNILLIGGPNHNSVTRELFFKDNPSFPFSFADDCTLICKGENGQVKTYTQTLLVE